MTVAVTEYTRPEFGSTLNTVYISEYSSDNISNNSLNPSDIKESFKHLEKNAKFLSDIIFSENDYALNTLLTLLPQRIEIHLLDSEDEFIKTVKLIFEDRVYICRECNICRTYKMIKMTKQQ